MPKVHPPTDRDSATIATVRFDIALFIGRGKYAHASARTLAEARNEAAPALEAEHPFGRRALIYAVDADGRSALVTDDISTESQESSMKTKKFNAQRAAKAAGHDLNEIEIVKAKDGFTWCLKQQPKHADTRDAKLTPMHRESRSRPASSARSASARRSRRLPAKASCPSHEPTRRRIEDGAVRRAEPAIRDLANDGIEDRCARSDFENGLRNRIEIVGVADALGEGEVHASCRPQPSPCALEFE